ncbi:hypothetical protein M422DRAFT_58383 [Sphaerobolus stellatus SS14]|nr:hypothetical protein M422DRAFT_58383 [Sphaerobolus stellatus SS14]
MGNGRLRKIDEEGVSATGSGLIREQASEDTALPPSFAMSEFETIIRRQRTRHPDGLKTVNIPTRFAGIGREWEFAGWGSLTYLELSSEELTTAERCMKEKPHTVGTLRGSSLPGNSVTASVFYAFPAVIAVASIFSPLSLLIACLILFLWKPILLELGSAIHLNGANYVYLLEVSGSTMGMVGASITLLDAIATSTVSAATAASYLEGEFAHHLAIPDSAITALLLTGLAIICLTNIKMSSSLTLTIFVFHMFVMAMLMVASAVAWARQGTDILAANWALRPKGSESIARAVFNGICVGFLGVTGFETTPTYIEIIDRPSYPRVLTIVLFSALILNAPMMLFVYALLPSETILSGTNILSILADSVAGKWLRIVVVVDCLFVLSGSVIGGITSACTLLERLAKDQVFSQALLKTLPFTEAQYVSIGLCFALNLLLYTSSAFSLATISAVFTVTFLSTLLMFVISNLLLKYNCDRLPRTTVASFIVVIFTLFAVLALLVGNIILQPKTLGLFAAYFTITFLPLTLIRAKDTASRLALWAYCQTSLVKWSWSSSWHIGFVNQIKKARRHPIIVWVDSDDVHDLVNLILYVRDNETTNHIVFVHVYRNIEDIPQELVPNSKILDEAFPAITIDLMFVHGIFNPSLVEAVSKKQKISLSKMFMLCPGAKHPWELGDYQGVRILAKHH